MSLELRAVSKRVGAETHIHDTNLTLAPEGFNVLLGATGAGKTTLIKLMAGLEAPTTGEVWFRGRNVTGVIPRKRNVSLVHQFFINYPTMTVYDNIASPLRVAGVARAEIDARVRETAEHQRLGGLGGGVDHDGAAAGEQPRQLVAQLLAQLVVEVRQRLVEQHQRAVLDDGAGQRRALLLPARELLRPPPEHRRQV